MKNNNKHVEEFHAVEFMRKVRSELTEQFFQDRKIYLIYLKRSMEEFKLKQKQIHNKR
jgi:hypothetical protein